MWKFSKHILKRMKERDFSKDEILKVVNENVLVLIIESPRDESIDIYFGRVERKFIMVPVNKLTKNLITVRNMRKNEKKAYLEEIKHAK